MIVVYFYRHNHHKESAAALGTFTVSEDTRETLLKLFRDGYNPSGALSHLKQQLDDSMSDGEYVKAAADRRIVPDYKYVWA